MIILFQNILLLKEFLACSGCLEIFTKIKKESGTNCWCTFSSWFFYENVPYLILLINLVSVSYLFSCSRYQTKYRVFQIALRGGEWKLDILLVGFFLLGGDCTRNIWIFQGFCDAHINIPYTLKSLNENWYQTLI